MGKLVGFGGQWIRGDGVLGRSGVHWIAASGLRSFAVSLDVSHRSWRNEDPVAGTGRYEYMWEMLMERFVLPAQNDCSAGFWCPVSPLLGTDIG